MRKTNLLIVLVLTSVISACTAATPTTSVPPASTLTPKCKGDICIQEADVLADEQMLSVAFVITDLNGQVDPDNPPHFKDDYIMLDLFRIGSDGTEKNAYSVYMPGTNLQCLTTNISQMFKGRLVTLCGDFAMQPATTEHVQVGDSVRVVLKDFEFEQVVVAHAPATLGDPNATGPTIAEAYLFNDMGGNISVTTFPRDQAVIRLMVVVANVLPGTKIKASWSVVDVSMAELANQKLGEFEQLTNDNGAHVFTMKVPASGVWPAGKYKVEVYLNNKLERTVEFTIE